MLVGKLEMFLFFSGIEFAVLGPGVVSGFNMCTAVNFHLRGNAVQAGSTGAASPFVVGPGAMPPASATTTDRRHAAPVPGSGGIICHSDSAGMGQVYVLDLVELRK